MPTTWNIVVQANPGGKYHDSPHGINVDYQNYGYRIVVNDETISILDSASEVDNVVEALKEFIRKFDSSSDENEDVCRCECDSEYLITEYTRNSENSDAEVYQYVADAEMMGTAVAEAIENDFKIVHKNDLSEECNLATYFEESGDYPCGCLVVVKIS